MKERIISFDELTDSREILEANPPRMMAYFIYLVLLMFLTALGWMLFGTIEVVVKASGVVRPEENISIVRNSTSGKIKEIRFPYGGEVKKGDLLFKFDCGSLEIEKAGLLREITENETELYGFMLFKKSLEKEKNLIPEADVKFYNKYIQYRIEREKLQLALLKAENAFTMELKLPSSMVTADKLGELKRIYNLSELSLKAFESETRLSLEEEIQSLKQKKSDVTDQLRKIDQSLENNYIHAPITGKILNIGMYNAGDFVPYNTELLKIIPAGSRDLKVELFVNNKDIANIKEKARIHYGFEALPHREYGYLTGSVIKIPGDVQMSEGNSNGIFIVEGSIDKTELKGKRKSAKVKVGMLCEGRIIVRKQRLFDFVLEKLDFKS